jgi:hypothetical protein
MESLVAGLWFKRESLIQWLNSDSSSKKPAVRLIEALRERNLLAESQDKSEEARRAGYDLHLEILKLTKPLRRTWWDLVPSPEMSDGLDSLRGWHLQQKQRGEVGKVLELVASLSEYKLLDSVRQCSCGEWFLAYHRRDKHHSPKCKREFEAAQRKTPEGRSERAKYMRELRATKRRIRSRSTAKR